MKYLRTFFDRFDLDSIQLQASDLEALYSIAQHKHYEAGDVFISLGTSRKKLGIIEKGLARGYRIKQSGEEVTIDFAKEGEIISAQDLILYEKVSEQVVEFLEPSEVFVFEYPAIEVLARQYIGIERLKYQFIEAYLTKICYRVETFLVYSPKERYEWLMAEEPELLKRVSQKHLASYLGITPVSLSRLRARR